ncbi:DUF6049 family protein [Frankia sp. QA3]|uniref:DUF6049 family protein n=1 Tax=Frankia sp. QA3 TaxID=710111 RepID=UPI000269C857|nr:DUF6049 family protein [Frankia sp. QA3]EIV95090.1 hypothetical protein FraQA3DRAFT_4893 [Frankia sp. QA3]
MTAPHRPARRARLRGLSAGRRWPVRFAAVVLLALVVPVAGSSVAGATVRGGLVERIARTDSATGTPRSSTTSSTDEPGNPLSSSPGTASASTGSGNPVTVSVDEVQAPAAGSSVVRVRGTLSTSVAQPLTDLRISLEIGSPPVSSRKELENLAEDTAAARNRPYRALSLAGGGGEQPLTNPPIRGANPVPFVIEGDLGTSARVGVFPLRVRVYGSVGGRAKVAIGAAYTFLVRSSGQQQRTPVAVVLPLADQPRLRSDGLLTDNALADEVKPGGRLYRLLEAARSTVTADEGRPTVTLAVDPTLVQALRIMKKPEGYEYASPTGKVRVPVNAYAAQFLNDIVNFADAGGAVIALPYGDADLAALVHAQKLDTVSYAVNTGQVVLAALLNRDPRQMESVAYPVDGLADTATVDVLRQLKVGTVLLDDRLLRPPAAVAYTPSAAYALSTSAGPIRALATDHRLAETATSYHGGPNAGIVLARFRADLGMITAEQSEQRFQVLALPRGWNPPDGWAQQVLGAIDSDYSASVPLDVGASGQHQPPARRGVLVYPADAQARELPGDYLDAVESVRAEAQALGPVLCQPLKATRTCRFERVDPMNNALVTATSVAWRGERMVDGVSLSQQVDGDVSAIRNGIQVVASRSVNLTSKHGLVPITLENNTNFEVTVVLAFSSTNHSRLRSPVRQTRTLPSGQKAQIEIEVDAEGAGTFPLEIRRLNLSGQALSTDPPTRVLVRSTVYGAIATAITIGAVSVLLLAVVLRLARRLWLGARRPAGAAGGAPDAPGGGAATPGGAGAGGAALPGHLGSEADADPLPVRRTTAAVPSSWSAGAPTADLSYAARRGQGVAPAGHGLDPGHRRDPDHRHDPGHGLDPGHGAAEEAGPGWDAATGQVPARRRRSGP